jgi:hypothetical protein
MGKLNALQDALTALDDQVANQIQGSLLASTDGFLIASTLREDNADRIAAMVATTTGVGNRMADVLDAGDLSETSIQGANRIILLYRAGEQGVLAVVAKTGSNVALINMSARETAEQVSGMLKQTSAA